MLTLRTTNMIESPFAAVRLRTSAAQRLKRVDTATAMIWRLALVAEKSCRKLNAPELCAAFYRGVWLPHGMRRIDTKDKKKIKLTRNRSSKRKRAAA